MINDSFARNVDTLPADVNALMKEQYQLIDRINAEPSFSVKKYFWFLWKIFLFFFTLLFLPWIVIINILPFLIRLVTGKKIYIPVYCIRYTKAAVKQFLAGEPDFLCLIPTRYLTRVFCTMHLKNRIKTVARYVQKYEIIAELNNADDTRSTLAKLSLFLNKYIDSLSWGLQLPILVATVSYLGVMSKIVDSARDILPKNQESKMKFADLFSKPSQFFKDLLNTQKGALETIYHNDPLLLCIISIVVAVITVVFIITPSSFIRARQLIKEQNMEHTDDYFADKYHIFIPVKFPLDLVLYMVPCILFLFSVFTVIAIYIGGNFETIFIISVAIVPLFFLFSFFRRVKAERIRGREEVVGGALVIA